MFADRVLSGMPPDNKALLDAWRAAVTQLRGVVTPDPDGDAGGANYGSSFRENDYAPIPRRDLPFEQVGNARIVHKICSSPQVEPFVFGVTRELLPVRNN